MASTQTFVILGASLTGVNPAQAPREEGFNARVVLLGDQPHRPSERPAPAKAYLQGTDPDIWAAGDVANAFHLVLNRHVRVETWANARHQGPLAARSMLGQDVSHTRAPYFYTDQYDLGVEYSGHSDPGRFDRVVLRGDVAGMRSQVFWLVGGRVQAGLHVNVWDCIDALRLLIRTRPQVEVTRVADPDALLTDT